MFYALTPITYISWYQNCQINKAFTVALVMHLRLILSIHIQAQWPRMGHEHHPTLHMGYGLLHLLPEKIPMHSSWGSSFIDLANTAVKLRYKVLLGTGKKQYIVSEVCCNHKGTHFILLLSIQIQLIKRQFIAVLCSTLFFKKCPKSFAASLTQHAFI